MDHPSCQQDAIIKHLPAAAGMGTEQGGDFKGILDNHYGNLIKSPTATQRGLSAPEVFHFGTSVRPARTGQSPPWPVFAVNLICDNVERRVLSDIQMNGSFTAERSIVAGFISPVSGFNVAAGPRPPRRGRVRHAGTCFCPRALPATLLPAILPPIA